MRVLCAMSGGVDSSVTAALLAEQGHDVQGVTLRLWGGESDQGCCSVADVDDARRVADHLGLDHHVFNFGPDFDRQVVGPLRRRPRRGANAQPLRGVQPAPEVRPAPGPGPGPRLRRHRHRPSRPGRRATRRHPSRRPGRRRSQGPVLRALHARPGRAGPGPAAGRHHDQGGGPGPGRGPRPAHGGQARQPGRLLHPGGGRAPGLPRVPHRPDPGTDCGCRRPEGRRGRRRRAGHGRPAPGPRPAQPAGTELRDLGGRGRRRR